MSKLSPFDNVLADICALWSSKDGLIGFVEEPKETGIRICVGVQDNIGLMPETCVVFKNDDVLYDGPIAGKTGLKAQLKKHKIKQIMWTTSADMNNRRKAKREHGRTRLDYAK